MGLAVVRRLRPRPGVADWRGGRGSTAGDYHEVGSRARRLSSVVEHPPCKRTVVSSILTGGSTYLSHENGMTRRITVIFRRSRRLIGPPWVTAFGTHWPTARAQM
jgi:hypothetical protein